MSKMINISTDFFHFPNYIFKFWGVGHIPEKLWDGGLGECPLLPHPWCTVDNKHLCNPIQNWYYSNNIYLFGSVQTPDASKESDISLWSNLNLTRANCAQKRRFCQINKQTNTEIDKQSERQTDSKIKRTNLQCNTTTLLIIRRR